MALKLSVVIPVFNEAPTRETSIERVAAAPTPRSPSRNVRPPQPAAKVHAPIPGAPRAPSRR